MKNKIQLNNKKEKDRESDFIVFSSELHIIPAAFLRTKGENEYVFTNR